MQSRNIKRAISTDFVAVIFCAKNISFLVILKIGNVSKMSQNRYSMNWGQIKNYDGNWIRNLCTADKINN
jgi:hypothetical protein